MNFQLSLVSKYLWGRKLRSFLTTLAIVIGVMVIFGMGILLPTMLQSFQASLSSISGQVDVTILHKTGEGFSVNNLRKVEKVEGVAAAAGSISRPMNIPANFYGRDSNVTALVLTGIDPAAEPDVREYTIADGRFLKPGDSNRAVISSNLADTLGLRLGDTLRLPTTEGVAKLEIVGLRPSQVSLGNEEVLIPLAQAQKLLDMPGLVNVMEASLTTRESAARERIVADIESQLGKNFVLNALTSESEILGALQTSEAVFYLLGVLTLFMGGFIIFNTFRTIVAERRHDIGMLRAIGASRGSIIGLIMTEGLVQGIVGTTIGLALGYLLGLTIVLGTSGLMAQYMNLQMTAPIVEPGLLIISIVLGVGVTLFAGLLPALSASRITPIQVLRPMIAESASRVNRVTTIAGGVMLVVAIAALFTGNFSLVALGGLLFLLGLVLVAPAIVKPFAILFSFVIAFIFAREGTGELAQGNITRQPSRSAITASATMIGLAIVVAAGGVAWSLNDTFVGMFNRSMNSDFLLVPPSIAIWKGNVGASRTLANKIRSVPGVGTVSTMRFAQSEMPTTGGGETPFSVLGIEPLTFVEVSGMEFQRGNSDEAYAALASDERTMIVNGILAAQAGLKVGETALLATPQGQQNYRIVAVAGDVLNAKINTAYISQTNLRADFNKTEDIFFQVNLAQGADYNAVQERLSTIVSDYPQFRLIATRAYIQEFNQQFDAIFAGLYVLVAILAIPSLIAILNTLAISVIERTREIGMLRAIGAERKQVRRMVIAEAVILAAIGTALGLLGGLYLSYLMVQGLNASGIYKMAYSFPYAGVIAAIAAGLLIGVLAAVFPARQASRMQIIQALRYE